MNKLKKIELSLALGLIFAVVLSFAGFESKCETIKRGMFRLRIIANSDTKFDQDVKLAVRDEILNTTKNVFCDCKDEKAAEEKAKENIDLINNAVLKTLNENHCEYSFKSEIKKEFFDTRVYDDFTLPAGEYNSLVVSLGKAKGHNWWCVLFPGVCLPAATEKDSLYDVFSDDTADIAYNAKDYKIRFKTAEIYEKIKQKYKKIKKQ